MFTRPTFVVVCALLVGGCTAVSEENPVSGPADPLVTFPGIEPPEVRTEWPCPPFAAVQTTQEGAVDTDGDNITDCQEEFLGSDPNNADSDGDTVGDYFEKGNLSANFDENLDGVLDAGRGLDSDGDGVLDLVDPDDDGDGVPTAEEDSLLYGFGNGNGNPRDDDFDGDGKPNYLDPDDDGDYMSGLAEDALGGNGNGDPRDDDFDLDGIPNYADPDDDNDTAAGCEDSDGNRVIDGRMVGGVLADDLDLDGFLNPFDDDDDGDGVATADEDWNGDGNACNDDLDGDLMPDFRDLDEENDSVPSVLEDIDGSGTVLDDDTDGDSIPDYRDADDDGDSVFTTSEAPAGGSFDARDTDRDGVPDYLDADDDNDGVSTLVEQTDGVALSDPLNADDDGDGCLTVNEPGSAYDAAVFPVDCPVHVTMTLTATEFGAFAATRVFIELFDSVGFVGTTSAVVSAGAFTVSFPLLIDAAETYRLDFFADANGNAACGPGETSWRIGGVSRGADFTLATTAADNLDPAACTSF